MPTNSPFVPAPLPSIGTLILPPLKYVDGLGFDVCCEDSVEECLKETDQVNSWCVRIQQIDNIWRCKLPGGFEAGLVCLVSWDGTKTNKRYPKAIRVNRHSVRGNAAFGEVVWSDEI